MNILFVCKYNRFRSRIAERYFNKINKNRDIHAESRGIIKGDYPLSKSEVSIAKNMGIDISGRPRAMDVGFLKNIDLIIIVADNVPKKVFYTTFKNRIISWKITDIEHNDGKDLIKRKVKKIMRKVERLSRKLENPSFIERIRLQRIKAEKDHILGK
jgi:protein-tyrosine-phosphatase